MTAGAAPAMRPSALAGMASLVLGIVLAAGCDQLVRLPLWPSRPDSNATAGDTEAWVQRAANDAGDEGLDTTLLAPLLVMVGEGQATVWFRNYGDEGEQVMARYEGTLPVAARLLEFHDRSPTLAGPSAWEHERIAAAVAADPEVQRVVGLPVSVLSLGFHGCDEQGVCVHARLAGSLIAAPPDAPGLAPIATVDMATLQVRLLVPEFPIGDP